MVKCALYDHLKAFPSPFSLSHGRSPEYRPGCSYSETSTCLHLRLPHTSSHKRQANILLGTSSGRVLFIRYKYNFLKIPASGVSQRINDPRGFLNDSANPKNVSASRT